MGAPERKSELKGLPVSAFLTASLAVLTRCRCHRRRAAQGAGADVGLQGRFADSRREHQDVSGASAVNGSCHRTCRLDCTRGGKGRLQSAFFSYLTHMTPPVLAAVSVYRVVAVLAERVGQGGTHASTAVSSPFDILTRLSMVRVYD